MPCKRRPILLIDWTSASPGERYQLLRASIALKGRSFTVYEQLYELCDYNTRQVHRRFLKDLQEILPPNSCPIIVTDVGYSVPWFEEVKNEVGIL